MQFLWQIIFFIQLQVKQCVKRSANLTACVCGSIEFILRVSYIHVPKGIQNLERCKMCTAVVKHYFKQPENQQGCVADEEMGDNSIPVAVVNWPRVEIRL